MEKINNIIQSGIVGFSGGLFFGSTYLGDWGAIPVAIFGCWISIMSEKHRLKKIESRKNLTYVSGGVVEK